MHIATVLVFAVLLVWAAVEDIQRLTISNWVSLGIVGLYPIHVLTSPVGVDWPLSVAIAFGTFAVGFILFALKMVGGGDVKLLSATSLWSAPALFPSFIMFTAIAGGVVGLVILLRRRRLAPAAANGVVGTEPAVMPYGVAIAAGGLMLALTLLKGTIL